MNQKFDPILHEKIRELFPLEMGASHVIEILCVEPLQFVATKYIDVGDLCEYTFKLACADKSYFVVDSIANSQPIFFYSDAWVTIEKCYFTEEVISYRTQDPNLKINTDDVKRELAQLVKLLESKAS